MAHGAIRALRGPWSTLSHPIREHELGVSLCGKSPGKPDDGASDRQTLVTAPDYATDISKSKQEPPPWRRFLHFILCAARIAKSITTTTVALRATTSSRSTSAAAPTAVLYAATAAASSGWRAQLALCPLFCGHIARPLNLGGYVNLPPHAPP